MGFTQAQLKLQGSVGWGHKNGLGTTAELSHIGIRGTEEFQDSKHQSSTGRT